MLVVTPPLDSQSLSASCGHLGRNSSWNGSHKNKSKNKLSRNLGITIAKKSELIEFNWNALYSHSQTFNQSLSG